MDKNIKLNIENTLQLFLGKHKNDYFIIGGHAAAYNLSLQGLSFRVTRDYDIVLVSEIENDDFANDLTSLLESGGYQFGYKASTNKKTAYRFESPKNDNYPEIIEFFVKEGAYIQSLDNRFAKLNIVVDEDKISAMVLNKEIYEFSKEHVIEINGLMFVDKPCLIALKSYAYLENLKLYKESKVKSDDYKKHARDILRIIGAFTPLEVNIIVGLPPILKDAIKEMIPILTSSKQQLKSIGLDKSEVINVLTTLIGE